jgi:pimeloyl-ACP methyl ester carboxylesterase
MPNRRGGDTEAPRFSLLLREPLALPKLVAAPLRKPVRVEPCGDDRPVLVIPGMLSGDASTSLLRRSLNAAGYRTHAAGLGLNLTVSAAKFQSLERRLRQIADCGGKGVIVIGWSLGGFYARVLAQRHPDLVSMVVTLGTPFSGDRRANNAWKFYELIARHPVDRPPLPDDPSIKPKPLTIAVWSSVDGIVSPASACGSADQRDVEVDIPFRHFELGSSRRAIARVVALLNEYVCQKS